MKHLMRVLVSQTARLSYIANQMNGSMLQTIRANINMCRCVCAGVCARVRLYISVLFALNLFRQDVHWIVAMWVSCVRTLVLVGSLILGYKISCPWCCWLLNWSGLPFGISHKYLLLGFFLELLYQSNKFWYVSVRSFSFTLLIWWLFFLLFFLLLSVCFVLVVLSFFFYVSFFRFSICFLYELHWNTFSQ